MPADAQLDRLFGALLGLPAAQFLCLLIRVTAALTFVPLPGLRQAPPTPRLLLAFALALLVAPAAKSSAAAAPPPLTISGLIGALPVEAALGIAAGVIVGWIVEAFSMGLQLLSLQAGFSYASLIDPATQADSGVLQLIGQLAAGLLFVSLGWEREVLSAFCASLGHAPPGAWHLHSGLTDLVIAWTSSMLTLAFRLALPVTALLLLLDVTLALLGRAQPQMPLINLALPVKMAATILLLALQVSSWPSMAGRAASALPEQLGRLGLPLVVQKSP